MALIAKDIPVDGVVLYTRTEYAISILVNGFISPIGIVLGTFVIYALQRQRSMSNSSLFIVNLCIGDLLVGIAGGGSGITDIIQGGWSHGPTGCIVVSEIMLIGASISIFSISALSLERFLLIVKNIQMTRMQTVALIILIWVGTLVVLLYPVYLGYSSSFSGLRPCKILCIVAWWNPDLHAKIAIYLCIIVITASALFINFCYMAIWSKYSQSETQMNKVLRGDITETHSSHHPTRIDGQKHPRIVQFHLSNAERKLLIKCACITGSFLLCWMPTLISIFIETITHTTISVEFDLFCTILAAASCPINSVILIYQDQRISSIFKEMVGWTTVVNKTAPENVPIVYEHENLHE